MKTYRNLYGRLCSYDNLKLAWTKARQRKTQREYVIEFESNLEGNIKELQYELETQIYSPAPLTVFIVRDPKTRKISASHFRDRVVHHALCNVIAPIFEKDFIHDSFANQIDKGTHKAILRYEAFVRKVAIVKRRGAENLHGFVLKADVRHYFDSINHDILLGIIKRKIKDDEVISLIEIILKNHKPEIDGVGIPLGNLTSQFFANVYLNELDWFVKHKIKVKYYIRYVDDFVIIHRDKQALENWKTEIDRFLRENLEVELHPEKSRIIPLTNGVTFLGFRIFYQHRLLKKSNVNRVWKRLKVFERRYRDGTVTDAEIKESVNGWLAYAKFADTYKLRKKVSNRAVQILRI